jgi:hypothetical protein
MDLKNKSYFDFNSKYVQVRIKVFERKIHNIVLKNKQIWELRYYPNIG